MNRADELRTLADRLQRNTEARWPGQWSRSGSDTQHGYMMPHPIHRTNVRAAVAALRSAAEDRQLQSEAMVDLRRQFTEEWRKTTEYERITEYRRRCHKAEVKLQDVEVAVQKAIAHATRPDARNWPSATCKEIAKILSAALNPIP